MTLHFWAYIRQKQIIVYSVLCMYASHHKISVKQRYFVYALFSRKPKTAAYAEAYAAVIEAWTSLGLNQGPPDYESVALTN